MLTNNEIKLINALDRKKERQKNGLFIVEGVKMVEELIKSNFQIEKIFKTEDCVLNHPADIISKQQLAKITQFSNANQVLALVKMPNWDNVDNSQTSIVLENINDPGNLGTIIRTADWFGINQIICSENSVDCFNPKVVSATMGSIFRSKIIYTDIKSYLQASTIPSYGALLAGESLHATKFSENCNLVFGSESHGLSDEIINLLNHKVTILGSGQSESLNLSIAVSIFCNHFFQNS